MKKLLSVLLVSAFAFSGGAVFAQREATVNTNQHNIYISGKADDVSVVTMMMKNKTDNTVAYVDEAEIKDGEYSLKFKFTEDYANYDLYVMDGSKNITYTVMETKAEALYPVGDVTKSKFSEDKKTADISAYINNKYNDAGTAKVIVSWYNASGAMVGCETADISYDYFSGSVSKTVNVPEGAEKGKVFIWSSMSDCIPLARTSKILPSKNVVLIGDSLGDFFVDSKCIRGWGQCIGKYMHDEANIINLCHAGWNAELYLAVENVGEQSNRWLQGWNYAKQFLNPGDYAIFGLGYNDANLMGYNGEYYEMVDGVKTIYNAGKDYSLNGSTIKDFKKQKDENGESYIETPKYGKIYFDGNVGIYELNRDTADKKYFSYRYEDKNGKIHTYADEAYYDSMKVMLDDCRDMGVNVILRDISCIYNPDLVRNDKLPGYHTWLGMSYINERAKQLGDEYENVTYVPLFETTKANFLKVREEFSGDKDNLPSYYYSDVENKVLKPQYENVTNWKQQQLVDKYFQTLRSYDEFYTGGEVLFNSSTNKYGYKTEDGSWIYEDTIHTNRAGADDTAYHLAQLIKKSDSSLSEYIK